MLNVEYIKEFKGGSMAKTYLINKSDQLYVRKQIQDESNTGLGLEKLKKQVDWILNLEKDISIKLPSISELFFDYSNNFGYYDMTYHNMLTLRDYIIKHQIVDENIENILKEAIRFCAGINKPQNHQISKEDALKYLNNQHLLKMVKRCDIVKKKSPTFNEFYSKNFLTINGKLYENLSSVFYRINEDAELMEFLAPKEFGRSHGDFTLQNILTDGEKFYIIDPRGEGDDTVYYDISKLYQSCDGKYDLLTKNNYECKHLLESASIDYKILQNVELFNKLFIIIESNIPQIFNLEENWQIKAKFYEASHFVSMVPFRFEENLEITILCYAMGVEMLNEVLKEWKNLKNMKD